MGRLITAVLLAGLIGLTGCGRVKRAVGMGDEPPPAKTPEEMQAELDAAKVKAEYEAQQAKIAAEQKAAQERAERERREADLKVADALVQKWADTAQQKASESGGFEQVEGLTDLDPWGNPVTVEYTQHWFNEVCTVRSNGPDGQPRTADDLLRVRKASNPLGLWSGMPWWANFLTIWFGMGLLAVPFNQGVASRRHRQGKTHHHAHPLMAGLAITLCGVVAFFVYMVQYVGPLVGAAGEFFDGFEFEFPSFD